MAKRLKKRSITLFRWKTYCLKSFVKASTYRCYVVTDGIKPSLYKNCINCVENMYIKCTFVFWLYSSGLKEAVRKATSDQMYSLYFDHFCTVEGMSTGCNKAIVGNKLYFPYDFPSSQLMIETVMKCTLWGYSPKLACYWKDDLMNQSPIYPVPYILSPTWLSGKFCNPLETNRHPCCLYSFIQTLLRYYFGLLEKL